MSQSRINAFYKDLQKESIPSFCFFHGKEIYLMERALKNLRETFAKKFPSHAYHSFHASNLNPNTFFAALDNLPMFNEGQFIVLKETGILPESYWGWLEKRFETLKESKDRILILFHHGKVDQRKRHIKQIQETAYTLEFPELKEAHLPSWIKRIAQSHGITMSPSAIYLMGEMLGPNLILIQSEISKLSDYLMENKPKEKKASSQLLLQSISPQNQNIFKLIDSIALKSPLGSLKKLSVFLLHERNNIFIFLSLLSRHIRILISLKENHQPSKVLLERTGLPFFFLMKYQNQARLWERDSLKGFLKEIIETDSLLKSSSLSHELLLGKLLLSRHYIYPPPKLPRQNSNPIPTLNPTPNSKLQTVRNI